MSNQNKTVATSAQTSKNSNKKENQTMENITKLVSNQRQDNIIDVINEMNKRSNISLGIAEIEFPTEPSRNIITTVRKTAKQQSTLHKSVWMHATATAIKQSE